MARRNKEIIPDYSTLFLTSTGIPIGFSNLAERPEVELCVNKIADLVSNMTIKLMENTEKGDVEVVNGLSKKVDISPYKSMNRKNFIYWIVKEALLKGNAFIFPIFKDDYLVDLVPLTNASVKVLKDGNYSVFSNGKEYDSDTLLNFVFNPKMNNPALGDSYKVKELVTNLANASKTKAEFMSGKYNPSLIVKVDSATASLSSQEGRDKIFDNYMKTSNSGAPWIIPAELLSVEQVRPLTLNDIAINDSVKLDQNMIAGIFGIPAFIFGNGTFNAQEFNNFISTTILSRAKVIEQTLTKGLIYSDKMYFKFNPASLYSYDLKEIYEVYGNAFTKGLVTGNEVRNKLGLSPLEQLEDLIILENYIKVDDISKQKKLIQEKGGDDE